MKTIALLTDFGTHDIYVGVMKGVMQRICPRATFIDIAHEIPPQSVQGGALALRHSYKFFTPGTVFLVVVDPGVGSARNPVIVRAGDYTFVAPDNGVLTYTLDELGTYQAAILSEERYRLADTSETFHGRDVFAPAAAYAACGVDIARFGPALDELIRLPLPLLKINNTTITGEITHIDHFGNIITSIGKLTWLREGVLRLRPLTQPDVVIDLDAQQSWVRMGEDVIKTIVRSYHAVAHDQLLTHLDSNGYLELSINQGNAASQLKAEIGTSVELHGILVRDNVH